MNILIIENNSQKIDLMNLTLLEEQGIFLFEKMASEIGHILKHASVNKTKVENPLVSVPLWGVTVVEDFFKELNLKAHYTGDTQLYNTVHVKASLRKGIFYASKAEASFDFEQAKKAPIFDLEVTDPVDQVQKNIIFTNPTTLQDFCKEIVKKVQTAKVPKTSLIQIKAPSYLVSPIEFALNKAGWGCVLDGKLSISAVSSTYFRNINKIRNNLPEKGKGINFYQLMDKISVEEVLFNSADDFTQRFKAAPAETAPVIKEFKIQTPPAQLKSVFDEVPPLNTVKVGLESVVAEIKNIEPVLVAAPVTSEPPVSTADEPNPVQTSLPKNEKLEIVEEKRDVRELVKSDKKVKSYKPKKYNSAMPFGNILEFLKDQGLKLTQNELKREIPVPVLTMANSIINDNQIQFIKVTSFLREKASELEIQTPDLLDSLVIFTRALSAKILDEEIIEGFGKDITTIKEVRGVIYA